MEALVRLALALVSGPALRIALVGAVFAAGAFAGYRYGDGAREKLIREALEQRLVAERRAAAEKIAQRDAALEESARREAAMKAITLATAREAEAAKRRLHDRELVRRDITEIFRRPDGRCCPATDADLGELQRLRFPAPPGGGDDPASPAAAPRQ